MDIGAGLHNGLHGSHVLHHNRVDICLGQQGIGELEEIGVGDFGPLPDQLHISADGLCLFYQLLGFCGPIFLLPSQDGLKVNPLASSLNGAPHRLQAVGIDGQ